MNPNDYGLSLDGLLQAGTNAYNATLANRTAKAGANAATAQAGSAVAQSNNLVRIAIIGGGILLAVVVGFFLFRRK